MRLILLPTTDYGQPIKKCFGPELAARQGISYMKKVHGDLIIINLYQECVLWFLSDKKCNNELKVCVWALK